MIYMTDEPDIIKMKADYETAITELDNANKQITDLKAEIGTLNAYIAKYVSSPEKAKNPDPIPEPKDFTDMYMDAIANLKDNE